MKRTAMAVLWLTVVVLWLADPAGAVERTWNGPATGDLFTAENWLPVEGQDYPQSGGAGGGRIAVWVGVSSAARDLYLAGNTKGVIVASTNALYAGTVSVTLGVGYREPPHVDAVDPGTAFFFTPKSQPGTVMMFR